MKVKRLSMMFTLLTAVGLVAILHAPLRWTVKKAHRQIFPEQIPDRPVYDALGAAPVDLAAFVGEARRAWPKADVGTVHAAAAGVATGLLLRSDVEVGRVVEGRFVPWAQPPWEASQKIHKELRATSTDPLPPGRYVFRRKPV